MAQRNWTPSQQAAIDFTGDNLILSAAAGSGKTATLTQRIIRLLTDPAGEASLSRMLIVTFTNAAAGELRSRIGDALTEALAKDPVNRRLLRELTMLPGARITTIHSFLLSSLRSYYAALGLPPEFSVLEEAQAVVLQKESMQETVSDFFDSPPQAGQDEAAFEALADCFSGGRDETSLDTALLSLRNTIVSEGFCASDLHRWAEETQVGAGDFLSSMFGEPVRRQMIRIGAHFSQVFQNLSGELSTCPDTEKYSSVALESAELAKALFRTAEKEYREAREWMEAFAQPRLSPLKAEKQTDVYVRLKESRQAFGEEIKGLRQSFFLPDEENMARLLEQNAAVCRAAARVLTAFEDRYAAKKLELGRVDFADLEIFAKKIFCTHDGGPTQAALDVGSQFDYVFIDEYQDTNRIQDQIFTAIASRSRRFMVGDVKQSIYGFRGACPDVFTDYRRRYEAGVGGQAIFMQENFRSHRNVIDFANLISRYIFAAGGAPFDAKDELICAKTGGDAGERPVEICLISSQEEEEEDAPANPEAEYVAGRIQDILQNETLSDGRPVRAGDIAILLRSGREAAAFADALSRRGIAVANSASDPFFACSEVILMLCLLNTADNPLRDIYLAGTMKSPLFGFTLDDLINIRGLEKGPLWYSVRRCAGDASPLGARCAAFTAQVEDWREAARYMRADEILQRIIRDTGFLYYRGDEKRSNTQIRRSLKLLTSHAAACGRQGGGLHDFIRLLSGLMEQKDTGGQLPAEDAVTITTIHRSKGLEYPICFLSDMARGFNTRGFTDRVLFSPNMGLAVKLYDPGGLVRCDTPLRQAAAMDLRERMVQEEMRVLYVALTRPRERLYITCKVQDPKHLLEQARFRAGETADAYRLFSCTCPGQWIIDGAAQHMEESCFQFVIGEGAQTYASIDQAERGEISVSPRERQEWRDTFLQRFAFVYPLEHLANIPAKLTVSALKPDILNLEEETALTIDTVWIPTRRETREIPMPAFLAGEKTAGAAEAGIATHMYMQFCDFHRLMEKGPQAELDCLLKAAFLTKEQAELVRLDEIAAFTQSAVFQRMVHAREMYREFRFNAVLPAARFTTDSVLKEKLAASKTDITVQGVVDCMFVDEEGCAVLLDYKTDRLTVAERGDPALAADKLLPRHQRQINLYRELCADMLGRPFDEVYLYSLALGDCIPVPQEILETSGAT